MNVMSAAEVAAAPGVRCPGCGWQYQPWGDEATLCKDCAQERARAQREDEWRWEHASWQVKLAAMENPEL